MRSLKFNSIPLALLVFTALFMVTQFARAQGDGAEAHQIHELGLHELRARELEARERHARELQALERATEELRLRNFDASTRARLSTDTTIPAGALGIVHVNRPREMTMLQLRGLAGSGSALLRLDDACISIPLRLVAGDFGGDSFSARRAAPIRIAVRSQDAFDALLEGDDLISDMYEVSSAMSNPDADLVLLDGLTPQHGFVINPGRSLLDDIFGVQGMYVPCEL